MITECPGMSWGEYRMSYRVGVSTKCRTLQGIQHCIIFVVDVEKQLFELGVCGDFHVSQLIDVHLNLC